MVATSVLPSLDSQVWPLICPDDAEDSSASDPLPRPGGSETEAREKSALEIWLL